MHRFFHEIKKAAKSSFSTHLSPNESAMKRDIDILFLMKAGNLQVMALDY